MRAMLMLALLLTGCRQAAWSCEPFVGALDEILCREYADRFVYHLFNYSPTNAGAQFDSAAELSAENAIQFVDERRKMLPRIAETQTHSAFITTSIGSAGRDDRGLLLFDLEGTIKKFITAKPLPTGVVRYRLACRYNGSNKDRRVEIVDIERIDGTNTAPTLAPTTR